MEQGLLRKIAKNTLITARELLLFQIGQQDSVLKADKFTTDLPAGNYGFELGLNIEHITNNDVYEFNFVIGRVEDITVR